MGRARQAVRNGREDSVRHAGTEAWRASRTGQAHRPLQEGRHGVEGMAGRQMRERPAEY